MIQKPQYDNSLVSLANSILAYFGAPTHHPGLGLLEPHLQEETVVLLLLDGMGSSILEGNLRPDGFFARHRVGAFSSVFPPTTVAATTSVRSGLQPCEHSWLGWDCYYPPIDQNVTVFRNTLTGTDIPAADKSVAETFCPYETVAEQIRRQGGQAMEATPYVEPYPQNFDDLCAHVEELCAKPGKKFIYAYWPEPDHTMHELGCYSPEIKEILANLESRVEQLSKKLQNTLLIVTADHGHMESRGVSIGDYPEILDCLIREPSIEPRAVNFFVKSERKQDFERAFQKEFGSVFFLLTKEQVLQQELFGDGPYHQNFQAMLGDYLAVAVGDLSIFWPKEKEFMVGVHAGLTAEEMNIPLILVKR